MSTEQERADFEAWVSRRTVVTKYGARLYQDRDGGYKDYRINDRWLAWKAGRAALQSQTIPASDWFDMFMELARAVVVANRLFAVSPTTTKQKVAADAAIALQEHARKHPALQSQDREDEVEFQIGIEGEVQAQTFGPREQAWAEIQRYAAQYAEDGPIEIWEVTRRRIEGDGE